MINHNYMEKWSWLLLNFKERRRKHGQNSQEYQFIYSSVRVLLKNGREPGLASEIYISIRFTIIPVLQSSGNRVQVYRVLQGSWSPENRKACACQCGFSRPVTSYPVLDTEVTLIKNRESSDKVGSDSVLSSPCSTEILFMFAEW